MTRLRVFLARGRDLIRRRQVDQELREEITSHLQEAIDDHVRRGLSPEDARLAAFRQFGGVSRTEDAHRDARSFMWLDQLARDVRHAGRALHRSPGFAVVAVLTLSVAIGAVTALFTVLDGVVLTPLDYSDSDRIVSIVNQYADRPVPLLTGGDEVDIAALPGAFDAIAYYSGGEMGVQLGDHAEFVGVRRVHPDFFRVFQLAPVAGRLFTREDQQRSAIVTVGFADRNYGGPVAALGKSIFVENRAYEIVGVMPVRMQFPARTDVWAAASLEPPNRNRSGHNYRAVARLAPGLSVEGTDARLSALAEHLAVAFPETNREKTFVAIPLRETLVANVETTLWILLGAVGLLLLIACANVANLMLARGETRFREIAVRAALGASRRRLLGQMFVESLLLAAVSTVLGLLFAYVGTHALLRAGTSYVPLPRLQDVHIDARVLAFSIVISLFTTIACGVAPAVRASRLSVTEALNHAGARNALGGRSAGMRSVLVLAQIALSCMLAVEAGLLLRSFTRLTETPLGFNREGVLVTYAHAPARGSFFDQSGLDNYLRVGRFFDDLLVRVRGLPNVIAPARRWVCQRASTMRTARTRSKASRRSPVISADCHRRDFDSPALAISKRWASRSCAGAISPRMTSTIVHTSPSSARRSRESSLAMTTRLAIGSSAVLISPIDG
jgi:predicted permease